MANALRIGLAGLGTVGTGVIQRIEENSALIARRGGRPTEITAITARDRSKDRGVDLSRLLALGQADPIGAILAAPVRDTIKRALAGEEPRSISTEPREQLWRALTPQLFRRGGLTRALQAAMRGNVAITDEAMAMERLGLKPLLVEGSEDNIKVTTAADIVLAESILKRMD